MEWLIRNISENGFIEEEDMRMCISVHLHELLNTAESVLNHR